MSGESDRIKENKMLKEADDKIFEYDMHYEVSTHTTAAVQEALNRHKGIESVYFLDEFNNEQLRTRDSSWRVEVSLPYAVSKHKPIPGLTVQAEINFVFGHDRRWPKGDYEINVATHIEVAVPDPKGNTPMILKYNFSKNRYKWVYDQKEWDRLGKKADYLKEIKEITELVLDNMFDSLKREAKLKDLLIYVEEKIKEDEVANMPWFKKFFNKLFKRSSRSKMAHRIATACLTDR